MARKKKLVLNWQHAGLGVLAAMTVGVVGFALTNDPAPASVAPAPTVSAPATKTPAPQPARFAAVGDSITEANSADFGAGTIGSGSWVGYAQSPSLLFAGGWADRGASTALMAESAGPVTADVLAVIAGTNDLGKVPVEVSQANVEAIVAKVGAGRVVVSAVPPYAPNPDLATEYNTSMKAFAASKGWAWVDAMTGVRNGDAWVEGMTGDGVHPNIQAARLIGESMSRALVQP